MADITVELVSVERMLWSGSASIVTAQTTEGEIGVLSGHEPMLGQLRENGVVTIRPVDGGKLVAAVHGGFLSISPEKVTILADYAIWADEVDTALAESQLQDADEFTRTRAEAEMSAVRRKAEA
ncbi:F0F1 ATP synthase subunit epsilon [Corynebacterium marinum]|jgi:F-type H+-transporting ATPase subunit epsilon|uniref:ATP synthase epsilon chain n=2 Tax=Corynebacterium marinum TaxID=349751 RepID=A0A0B6TV58_9CORY|nr:F0F1 ATP synthase subunit epsilon [Corynebacterium marinum]AJK68636.1 ATP synthase F0F1 subunit epsilon [Corynebacterium marinum DSM 44953]NLF90929.1 F0F1 ATP synthase subunit epsilon [Corynebacterium marinum]GGO14232.1 ATP synthase epsilon chain [Corynebacterium marinum]